MSVATAAPQHTVSARRAMAFARGAALLTVFLIAARPFLGQGLTLGHIATLLTAPLWFPAIRRFTGGVWLGVVGLVASVSAVWLTSASSVDHATTPSNLTGNTLLIAGSIAAIVVLFWAREILPVWLIGVVYGTGMLVAVVTHQDTIGFNAGSGGEVNPWKFAFAVPFGIIALSASMRTRRRLVEIIALLVLAGLSAKFDSRSYFGEFVIAALLVLLQVLPVLGRRTSALRVLVVFGVVIVAVYNIGLQLVVGGALGISTQERTVSQIQRAGSVIVGGRPEMGASVALFLSRPFGFGAGTIASAQDIETAKAGMLKVNYDPDNGYVENFLFGTKIELHSTAADLWAYSGLAGLLLAAVFLVLMLIAVSRGIATRSASGLVLFVAVQGCWDLFFNPLYSSAPVIVLALGLGSTLLRREAGTLPTPASDLLREDLDSAVPVRHAEVGR